MSHAASSGSFLVTLAALAAFAFAACATPYGAKGMGRDGVESRQVEDGVYYIEVVVNRATSEGQADEYFQRRALEVCTGDGYDDFETLETTVGTEDATTMVSDGKGHFTARPGSFYKLSGHVRCLAPAPGAPAKLQEPESIEDPED
jgi:hypothetical protein